MTNFITKPAIGLTLGSDSGIAGDDITKVTRPTFTGLAVAGSTVIVHIDGKLAGTALASATGRWNFTPAIAMAGGKHAITATAVGGVPEAGRYGHGAERRHACGQRTCQCRQHGGGDRHIVADADHPPCARQ